MDINKKILRSSVKSVDMTDTDKRIDIPFVSTSDSLVDTNVYGTVSAYEQFVTERNNCHDYRVILSINPFCTNVLFNGATEITIDEGSENVIAITNDNKYSFNESQTPKPIGKNRNLTPYDMIRNTEYSSEKYKPQFEYKPGYDFFNNHILRNKSYRIVNQLHKNASVNDREIFNTIEDYMRDSDGRNIERCCRLDISDSEMMDKHLYDYDDILSYENGDAVNENLREKDGWFGFYNTTVIPSKDSDGNDMDISRAINNKGNCEFIDMYPDRSLFSFVPKLNKFRKRLEYNWDIELTYAYDSCTKDDEGNDILLIQDGDINALYIAEAKYIINGKGISEVQFRTFTKHNLDRNDYVRLYFTEDQNKGIGNTEWNRLDDTYIVSRTGDLNGNNRDYYFSISDVQLLNDIFAMPRCEGYTSWDYVRDYFYIENNSYTGKCVKYSDDGLTNIPNSDDAYIKVSNKVYELYNHDTQKSYSSVSDKMSADEFIREIINNAFTCDDGVENPVNESSWSDYIQFRFAKADRNCDCRYYVRKLKKFGDLNNEYYRLGYSDTIYGDPSVQITYTDTIHTDGLKDNLGRPLTEIFATIVKSNRGHKEWYENNDKHSDNVEFSHCFGNVTCGFKLFSLQNDDIETKIKRHKLCDITMINNNGKSISDDISSAYPNTIGSKTDINIGDDWFYGDIVEFNPIDFTETVICDVDFRFNTAQRELNTNSNYSIIYDEIISDDFDKYGFNIKNEDISDRLTRPEGYYYKPHYPFKIKSDGNIQQSSHRSLTVSNASPIQSEDIFIKVKCLYRHNISSNDRIVIIDRKGNNEWITNVVYVIDKYTFVINKINKSNENYCDWIRLCKGINSGDYQVRVFNESIPEYAYKTGVSTYIWRDIVNPWDIDESNEFVFANGTLYIDDRINFYLRRQDPDGSNELYVPYDVFGVTNKIESNYFYKEESEAEC